MTPASKNQLFTEGQGYYCQLHLVLWMNGHMTVIHTYSMEIGLHLTSFTSCQMAAFHPVTVMRCSDCLMIVKSQTNMFIVAMTQHKIHSCE